MGEEITVWKIEHGGASYLEENVGNLVDTLADMDIDGYYIITKKKLSRAEYDRLPEFTGF